MQTTSAQRPEMRNLILAIVCATAVMIGWQYFYERPRMLARQAHQEAVAEKEAAKKAPVAAAPENAGAASTGPRIRINSEVVHGSIALTGSRFDDLTLAEYRETIDPESPEVTLLQKTGTRDAYFAEVGVLAGEGVRVPDSSTQWQTSNTELTPSKPVTLRWNNGAGLSFEKKIELDANNMFTITTTVTNHGASGATLYPYGLISRNYEDKGKHFAIMHEGPLGVVNGALEDMTYKTLREDGPQKFDKSSWIGMTDKYWLTAIIPAEGVYNAEFKHFKRGDAEAYQSNLRGDALDVAPGSSASFTMRMFAGAKVVKNLDSYRDEYNIPLFDRAVDFGSLYFLTRPIFAMLTYFYSVVGNFGVAILLLTLVIKTLLFPLASKSMTSMARTKQLMPKMQEIREKHSADKLKMNQEIMALYKREKVNPASGCLPLLLQIPVFFALYRVLFVTIEMRHAPFFGWINDLSAVDPTNIFNLFGVLPFTPPSFLHIGIWPLIMCVTMVLQQRLSPKPADEVQAAVMSYMPYLFLFLFASFPAGLVIYWAWNNTLTVLQMLYINGRLKKKGLK